MSNQHERCQVLDAERREGGQREAGDRHEALGDARRVEPGEPLPQRSRSPGGWRRGRRGTEAARRAPGASRGPAGCGRRRGPTSATSGVTQPTKTSSSTPDPTERVTKSETSAEYRSTCANERPVPIEPGDRPAVDEQPRGDRRRRPGARLPPVGARQPRPRIAEREGDRAEREVELARERERRQRKRRRARSAGARGRGAWPGGGTRSARGGARSTGRRGRASGRRPRLPRAPPARERPSARSHQQANPPARTNERRTTRS